MNSIVSTTTNPAARHAAPSFLEARAYAKVTWHLLPFLFLCYVAAYLDRVNVGFAKLQMLSDLQFSETVYGLGAGIFFIGYFFFEVPSNILLHRLGARAWIARIMLTWSVISATSMLVRTPMQFYIARFLLGLAEAGFFPGIVLYLTYWFPCARRSRMNALFMIGIPFAGVIGGPLSGWILSAFQNAAGGWANWQWLFLIEAAPSFVLGIITLFYLPNGIRGASWLSEEEKSVLERNIQAERGAQSQASIASIFGNARVWLLAITYFGCMMGLYGIGFYLPTLIKASGVQSPLDVGLLTAVPYACAVVSMIVVAYSADRTGERRWHFALAALLSAAGFYFSTVFASNVPLAMLALSVATAGVLATMPVFWIFPSATLAGGSAAAAIGLINSVGNLAGFVSPSIIGWFKDITSSTNAGMYFVAVAMVIAAALALTQRKDLVNS